MHSFKTLGHLIITDVESNKILIWDIEKTDLIKTINLDKAPKELSFGEENENFLYACTEGQINVYNGQNYSFVKSIICNAINEIYVLRTWNDHIIIGGQGAKVSVLDQKGEVVHEITEYNEMVSGMKIYNNMLITGDKLGQVFIHIMGIWSKYALLDGHKGMTRIKLHKSYSKD